MESTPEIRLLRTIAEVQEQVIEELEPRLVFDGLLTRLLALTESEYGFIGQILSRADGSPYLKTRAISNVAWDEDTRACLAENSPEGLEFDNLQTLFGHVIASGQPLIANDPGRDPRRGGLPAGHPPLAAFLGIPLHRGKRLVGMVGVANRAGGYEERLIEELQPFLATCAAIIETFAFKRQQRQAEAALRDSERRYRSLVEDQPDPICRFDPGGLLTFVNRAYAAYFDRRVEDCEGLNLFELIPASDHEAVRSHFRGMSPDRPVARHEHRVIARDGEVRWMHWTNRAHFDEKGRVVEYQSIGQDVTDRRRAEEERRNLESQLRQAQKLESLGALAGGVAHDFNNLLTGILGHASLAEMELPSDSVARHHIEQIERASQRAAELCAQMLTYSGKARFNTEAVDLSEQVEELLQALAPSLPENVALEWDLPRDLPTIQADAPLIRQAVTNLITNATEAIGKEAGRIRVTTGTADCDRAEAQRGQEHENPASRCAFLEVVDTGCGMDERIVAQIFDPFFTTKFPGRGLGLAAVMGIVRGHNGTIRVRSRPEGGTTIRLLFPPSEKPVVAVEEAPASPLAPGERSGLVLVVDDEKVVREFARQSLERFGFDVLLARDGREGLKIFRERTGEIGAVLLDLTMPELSGEEVLREMRKICKRTPVILSSGFDAEDAAGRFDGLQLTDFLQKPYGTQELLACLDTALATG